MRYSHSALQDLVEFGLVHQLGMGSCFRLKFDGHFFARSDGDAQVDVPERASSDLAHQTIASSHDKLATGHNPQIVHFGCPGQDSGRSWILLHLQPRK